VELLTSTQNFQLDGISHTISTSIDITERKQMEEDLRRSNAELEQFAYVASHDLQEPLRTVAGMVELLQQRYQGQLDARADEYIHHAVDASNRMQKLINDLLDFSRVDRKGQPFEPTQVDMLLQTALTNLRAAITESQAHITYDPMPVVNADGRQLAQVFQNLVGNAIKFRSERPLEIHIGVEKIENGWKFAVQDNGIGIDPQYFERVFLLFQRLHTRRKYPGTGIGLALCKKIIERHGGKIWIESTLNQGATFFFTLPER
jgi:light-regulated signal transduction histidine kinase (bacteriophytochrome)